MPEYSDRHPLSFPAIRITGCITTIFPISVTLTMKCEINLIKHSHVCIVYCESKFKHKLLQASQSALQPGTSLAI